MRTSPPRASMKRRAGSAYSSSSGHSGKPERRVSRTAAEHLAPARARTAARPPRAIDWFSAASASGSHSISRSRAVWPLLISHSSTVSPGDAAMRVGVCPLPSARCPACAIRIGRAMPQRRQPIAPASASQSSSPPSRLSGARQRRTAQPAPRARAIDEVDVETRLQPHAIVRADLSQERERLVVAAEQHVLAVVDALARLRIGERGRAAAEHGLRFEHEHRARRARASATAALSPATPAPMTMTSGDAWSFQRHHDLQPGAARRSPPGADAARECCCRNTS